MQTVTDNTSTILLRVLDRDGEGMSPEIARYILTLDFSEQDHARYAELSSKVQEGTLTDDERRELEGYLNVDSYLALWRLRAQDALEH